jgi:hypothetical protein
MSLAIHEGMDSRGSHHENDSSRKGPACHRKRKTKIITACRCSCLLLSMKVWIQEVLDSRGTIQAVRDPHDTEGVRCTYIGHDGIVLGVTPPGDLRKMNQDDNCLFNANII